MSKSLPSGVLGSMPEAVADVAEAGLILQLRGTGPGRKNVLRLVPPMTTTEVEIDRALAVLDEALAAEGHPARVGRKSARPTPPR